MSSEQSAQTREVSQRPLRGAVARWPTLLLAIVFGFFYAYEEWEAVGSLLQLPAVYADAEKSGIHLGDVPWGLLICGVVIPAVGYALALFLGRRQRFVDRIVILFVGLAVVAALSLAVIDLGRLI
ncbi:MAG: hypothetical protein JWR36_2041 [Glaciihabitans sp.]|jgi:hypothetical protein|nr:hypothetical protein [Glaciihabitans sp.]